MNESSRVTHLCVVLMLFWPLNVSASRHSHLLSSYYQKGFSVALQIYHNSGMNCFLLLHLLCIFLCVIMHCRIFIPELGSVFSLIIIIKIIRGHSFLSRYSTYCMIVAYLFVFTRVSSTSLFKIFIRSDKHPVGVNKSPLFNTFSYIFFCITRLM